MHLRSFKPNVSYRGDRRRSFERANAIHGHLQNSHYKYFRKEELALLSPNEATMLACHTAMIKKCGACGKCFIVATKAYLKYQRANVAKFGYTFRCRNCAFGLPVTKVDNDKFKLLATIHERMAKDVES